VKARACSFLRARTLYRSAVPSRTVRSSSSSFRPAPPPRSSFAARPRSNTLASIEPGLPGFLSSSRPHPTASTRRPADRNQPSAITTQHPFGRIRPAAVTPPARERRSTGAPLPAPPIGHPATFAAFRRVRNQCTVAGAPIPRDARPSTASLVPPPGFRSLPAVFSAIELAGLFHPAATSRISRPGCSPLAQRPSLIGRSCPLAVARRELTDRDRLPPAALSASRP